MKLPKENDEVRRTRRSGRNNRQRPDRRMSASAHIPRTGITEMLELPSREDEETRVPISINVASYTVEDLEELRRNDPFMYFSIPSVRNANLRHEDVPRQMSRRNSLPSGGSVRSGDRPAQGRDNNRRHNQGNQDSQQVLRQSRISFEAHSSVIMSELLESLGDDFDDGYDDDDTFDSLFG